MNFSFLLIFFIFLLCFFFLQKLFNTHTCIALAYAFQPHFIAFLSLRAINSRIIIIAIISNLQWDSFFHFYFFSSASTLCIQSLQYLGYIQAIDSAFFPPNGRRTNGYVYGIVWSMDFTMRFYTIPFPLYTYPIPIFKDLPNVISSEESYSNTQRMKCEIKIYTCR